MKTVIATSALTGAQKAFSEEIVQVYTTSELKDFHRKLTGLTGPGKKIDVANAVAKLALGAELRNALGKMFEVELQALAEATSPRGLEPVSFESLYGKPLPRTGLLDLMLLGNVLGVYRIRQQILDNIKDLLPPPREIKLQSHVDCPATIQQEYVKSEWQPDDAGGTIVRTRHGVYQMPSKPPVRTKIVEEYPVQQSLRAETTQFELDSVMRLIADRQVCISAKTGLPIGGSEHAIAKHIGGDYYGDSGDFDAIGYMRPFAWPVLLHNSSLTTLGKRSELILEQQAIKADPPTLLKQLWNDWLLSPFDEFSRIDAIKGQGGKGKADLTKPSSRRAKIAAILGDCPENEWISVDDFARYMRTQRSDFDVTYAPWNLYIVNPFYGSFSPDQWNDLGVIYIKAFLFEYAATLGLIDVAYVNPCNVRTERISAIDELPFLSRYDGLMYFRVNELGSFCLGKSKKYRPVQKSKAKIKIMPDLRVEGDLKTLSISDAMTLQAFAEPLAEGAWQLSSEKAIAACEEGRSVSELREMFARLDDQELPPRVEAFLTKIERNAYAVQFIGNAVIFHCIKKEIAEEISKHILTSKLCTNAGKGLLVVKANDEQKFRKAIRIIGYGSAVRS